jgi:hypothetical protein
VTENHAFVAVPVALMIQAMPKRIAAMMASMPCCFPYDTVIFGPPAGSHPIVITGI